MTWKNSHRIMDWATGNNPCMALGLTLMEATGVSRNSSLTKALQKLKALLDKPVVGRELFRKIGNLIYDSRRSSVFHYLMTTNVYGVRSCKKALKSHGLRSSRARRKFAIIFSVLRGRLIYLPLQLYRFLLQLYRIREEGRGSFLESLDSIPCFLSVLAGHCSPRLLLLRFW